MRLRSLGPVASENQYRALNSPDIYAEVKFDAIVQPTRDMATRCLAGPKALPSVIVARTLLVGPIFATNSSEGAFGARMRKNVPSGMIGAPLLIAQCKAGQRLDYRAYTGRTYLPLVASDAPAIADLVR